MKYKSENQRKSRCARWISKYSSMMNDEFAQGALQLMYELGNDLMKITDMKGITLQPAQVRWRTYRILMIRAYHLDRGDTKRTKILIPILHMVQILPVRLLAVFRL